MANQEVWRKVGGQAVRCTDCQMNSGHILTDDIPVGIEYTCDAPKGVCVFLNEAPDNDKWYADFKDVYKDVEEDIHKAIEEMREENG